MADRRRWYMMAWTLRDGIYEQVYTDYDTLADAVDQAKIYEKINNSVGYRKYIVDSIYHR